MKLVLVSFLENNEIQIPKFITVLIFIMF